MSQSDALQHGPPPPADEGAAFGTRAVRVNGRIGVRIMLRGFDVMTDRGGPIAFVEIQIPSAVQAVQALRQAVNDARRGWTP
jgi:hypothetical protein